MILLRNIRVEKCDLVNRGIVVLKIYAWFVLTVVS